MKDFVVEFLNEEQFLQVARFYDWRHFVKEQIKKQTHCIYFRDGKPSGWDDDVKHSKNSFTSRLTFKEWAKANNQSIKEQTTKVPTMKYVVEVSNWDEAYTYLQSIGNPQQLGDHIFRSYKVCGITLKGSYADIDFYKKHVAEYGVVITFRDWALATGTKLIVRKPNQTLKLTSDYNAVVNYNEKVVQVGCQTIPFDTVKELYTLTIK